MRKEITRIAASAMTFLTLTSISSVRSPIHAATILEDNSTPISTYPGDNAVYEDHKLFKTFKGKEVEVNCVSDGNDVWLVDKKRNIRVIENGRRVVSYKDGDKYEVFHTPTSINPLTMDANTWNTKAELLYNVGQVYDYFKKTFRIDNFDFTDPGHIGDQGLYVFEFDHSGDARSNVRTDGYGKCEEYYVNLMGFGQDDIYDNDEEDSEKCFYNMGVDIGIIGHELTHLLVKRELGWWPANMDTETEALMEAYCDILGELCEKEPDWKVGGDIFKANTPSNKIYSLRDMKAPGTTMNPKYSNVNVEMYDDYSNYMRNHEALKKNNPYASDMFPCYLGTTVIDHAAYLMSESIPKDKLATIWYCSIFHYTGDATKATFVDCRNAVESATTQIFGDSSAELKAVQDAFEKVRVKKHRTFISQAEGASTQFMSDFVRNESNKLPEGRYWNTGNPDTTSGTSIGNDTNTFLPMGPTTLPGFRSLFWQNEEPYYQCAGFAKKLQIDYFGTDTFVQNSDAEHYVPELGDHLRVHVYHKSEDMGIHSVFIRSIDDNNIIFADCNFGETNVIMWNKKVRYSRDINNNFYMSDDLYTYKFEWVERPIKQGDTNADGVINNDDLAAMDNIINGNVSYRMHDGLLREFTADMNGDYLINNYDKELLIELINNNDDSKWKYGFVIY